MTQKKPVSTAQGCIDRLSAEWKRLQETYEPISDEFRNLLGFTKADALASDKWTLISPEGRKWTGESGLRAVAAEMRERIPPDVMLKRILSAAGEADAPEAKEPDYEALEKEHFGNAEKKTGIYAHQTVPDAYEQFAQYFEQNYSGDVVFTNPRWHAEKLWRVAKRLLAAAEG